jgi:hypothetical protein
MTIPIAGLIGGGLSKSNPRFSSRFTGSRALWLPKPTEPLFHAAPITRFEPNN